jgi:hypothetical protein
LSIDALRHDCVLLLPVVSLAERALARAGKSKEPSFAEVARNRIPAEHDFCSFPDIGATDNLDLQGRDLTQRAPRPEHGGRRGDTPGQ